MKVYIEVYGCALNRSDAMYAKEMLMEQGFEIVDDIKEADAVILFTCIVRRDTELKMIKRLTELCKEFRGRIVVAGCMASALPERIRSTCPSASLVTPRGLSKIARALKGEKIVDEDVRIFDRIPMYFEGVRATIAVADGCLDECSFCIIKKARPNLVSAPIERIVDAVKCAISRGVVEIELTAQDLAVYGYDRYGKFMLPELLHRILEIEGDFRIRLGQMNPKYIAKFIDELIEILRDPRVYKHVHIPVQSGNDRVLNAMNRGYSAELFRDVVSELRNKIENIHIATDVIVGFPTETEFEFLDTVKLILELDIDRVHIARFSLRPKTKAVSMKQIPEPIKKLRSSYMEALYELVGMSKNMEFVGALVSGYVVEYDSSRNSYVVRAPDYRSIVVKNCSKRNLLGEKVLVKITEASFYDLRGVIMDLH